MITDDALQVLEAVEIILAVHGDTNGASLHHLQDALKWDDQRCRDAFESLFEHELVNFLPGTAGTWFLVPLWENVKLYAAVNELAIVEGVK